MNALRILPVLLPFLAACAAADAGAPETAAVRDSAGIRIVENCDGAWREGEGWRLADAPLVQIGTADGDARYMFDRLRTVLRLDDGRIVAANVGSSQLRFYTADGRHLASAGRRGKGPGEFEGITLVRRIPGDTLLLYQGHIGQVQLFGPDARFARSWRMPAIEEVPVEMVDRLADGSLLGSRNIRRFDGVPTGRYRDTLLWMRVDPVSGRRDTLGTTPGNEAEVEVLAQGSAGTTISMAMQPFMQAAHTVAAGDRYWQGITDRYELVLRRADGTPERIVRRDVQPAPVRGAYLDSLRAVRVAESGPGAGRALDRLSVPERLPVWARMLVDDAGHLWVQRMPWPGYVQPEWDVFDADGRLLGAVGMPAGFRATHIGADFVLGVWKDEDAVEYVRMYRLEK